ncbi:hypothetical protein Holit_03008 [Hollandina sp. SP2]
MNLEMLKNKAVPLSQKLSKYNIETMIELKNKTFTENGNDFIDDMTIQMLKSAINTYMDKYAEGQKELKTFICIISVYLTFIAKKP